MLYKILALIIQRIICNYYLRDFKPQNLLVFEGGRVVKIADMGISRMATEQSMTEFTGTQLYISPGKEIELLSLV